MNKTHPGRDGCMAAMLVTLLVMAAGCGREEDGPPDTPSAGMGGHWRAVLASPGGELPFGLEIEDRDGTLRAWVLNGQERLPFTAVEREGRQVHLRLDHYDSGIEATLSEDGNRLTGTWRKRVPEGESSLPFTALRGESARFLPEEMPPTAVAAGPARVAGSWQVTFTDEDGRQPAQAIFQQDGDTVTGTFRTPLGDYRYLEGDYRNGLLRLSCFDGGHAFLFRAVATSASTLEGSFWSRDSYLATWTATLVEDEDLPALPDPYATVHLTSADGRFHFSFPDLEGQAVSLSDARFQGRVVLVNIFGSWCPNCNDEAPLLAGWYRRWHEDGLDIIGLAYEFSGDGDRDRRMLRLFAGRHGVEYPLLLAGTSDKKDAAATLPDLDGLVAYPTTLFIGRDGRVRRIHSGFDGPATGDAHRRLLAEFEGLIQELLAEPPSSS